MKTKWIRYTRILLLLHFMNLPVYSSDDHQHLVGEHKHSTSIALFWDTRYVSEGRDNLEDGGLFSVEGNLETEPISLILWYGVADSVNYQELNLTIEYGVNYGNFDAYLSYTRLEFTQNDSSDNEISAGVAYSGWAHFFVPAFDLTYGTEAAGSFIEISLNRDIQLLDDRLTITPYLVEGLDLGFASDAFDGPNHLLLGIKVTATYNQLEINASLAHSFEQKGFFTEVRL